MGDYAYLDEDFAVQEAYSYEEGYAKTGDRQRLKQEWCGDYFVSTIFLILNHGFNHVDQWFETYVFPKDDSERGWSGLEVWGERASTYSQALSNHKHAITLIEAGEIEDD